MHRLLAPIDNQALSRRKVSILPGRKVEPLRTKQHALLRLGYWVVVGVLAVRTERCRDEDGGGNEKATGKVKHGISIEEVVAFRAIAVVTGRAHLVVAGSALSPQACTVNSSSRLTFAKEDPPRRPRSASRQSVGRSA